MNFSYALTLVVSVESLIYKNLVHFNDSTLPIREKGEKMKYTFTKIDEDTTELRYKDKVFPIKKDIDLQKRIQSAIPRARVLMSAELAKMGLTKKDLVIERHEGNKTYYDNSNILDAEEQYQAIATMEVFDEILVKYTKMTLNELIQDMELENEEVAVFGTDLTNAIMGREIIPKEETFPRVEIEEV